MFASRLRPFLRVKRGSQFESSITFINFSWISSFSNGSRILSSNSLTPSRSLTTSSRRPSLPPALLSLIKPVARVSAAISGRAVRIWWRKLPQERRESIKTALGKYKWTLVVGGSLVVGAVAYGYRTRVQLCPITGRKKFIALTKEQVNRISEAELKQQLVDMKCDILPNCHPIYDQVCGVANQLLAGNRDLPQIYDKQWTVYFVNSDVINAFVHPTGKIFVFHGMYEKCCNDDGSLNQDQLGVILGHEMAHAILDHPAEILTRSNFAEACLLIPMTLLWSLVPHSGVGCDLLIGWYVDALTELLLENPFSRELEAEADSVGLKMAAKACFDVREGAVFWGKMELLDDLGEEFNLDDDATRFLAKVKGYMASHPAHCSRQEEFFAQLKEALELRTKCGCGELDAVSEPAQMLGVWKEKLEVKRKQMRKDMKRIKIVEAERREKLRQEAEDMRRKEEMKGCDVNLDSGVILKLPQQEHQVPQQQHEARV